MSHGKGNRDWGRGVVDLLNTTFDFDIAYIPPVSPPLWKNPDERNLRSPKRLDRPVVPADEFRSSTFSDQRFHRPYVSPMTILDESPSKEEAEDLQDEIEIPSNMRSFMDQKPRHHYTSSYRLPDFFKRVFAPPNCCTPLVDSPEHSPIDTARMNSDHRDALHQAVFGSLGRPDISDISGRTASTMPNLTRPRSRPQLPWLSLNSRGSARSLPTASPQPWSGLDRWQRGRPTREHDSQLHTQLESSPGAGDCGSSDSGQMSSCSDLDPDMTRSTYSSIAEPIRAENDRFHGMTRSMLSQRATGKADDRQAEIDRDIEAFLNSTPQPRPLYAPEILALCEGVTKADNSEQAADRASAPENPDAQSAGGFFPRRTIGKLSRLRDRRMLSVESVHEDF